MLEQRTYKRRETYQDVINTHAIEISFYRIIDKSNKNGRVAYSSFASKCGFNQIHSPFQMGNLWLFVVACDDISTKSKKKIRYFRLFLCDLHKIATNQINGHQQILANQLKIKRRIWQYLELCEDHSTKKSSKKHLIKLAIFFFSKLVIEFVIKNVFMWLGTSISVKREEKKKKTYVGDKCLCFTLMAVLLL